MPSGSLGQLTIDLAANVTKFERALNRAERLADKRSSKMVRHFKRAATGIGLALGTLGLVKATENAFAFADAIGKSADRAGVSTDRLQEMRFAMDQFGVSTQQTDDGLRRFTRRLGVALEGGSFAKAFDDMNVSIRDSNDAFLGTEAVLDQTINALAAMEDQATRSAFAAQVFGDDAGPQLSVALAQGGEALREYAKRAHDSGAIMRADVVDAAESANDRISELANTLRVQFSTALIQSAPAIEAAARGLLSFVTAVGKAIGGIDAMNTEELEDRVRSLGEELERLQNKQTDIKLLQDGNLLDQAMAALMPSPETLQTRIDAIERKIQESYTRLGELYETQRLKNQKNINPLTGMTDEELKASNEAQLQEIMWLADRSREIDELVAAEKKQNQQTVQDFMAASGQSIAANAVSLLQILGRENENYARAAIVLQKGLAIAQATINTAVAVTAAMAIGPAGLAMVPQIKALGAAQVALIAATGIGQLASLNTAGGSLSGTTAAPVATTPTDIATGEPLTGTSGTLTINVNGVVTEEVLNDLILPAIQDAVGNKDVILFRNDSRQAQELLA